MTPERESIEECAGLLRQVQEAITSEHGLENGLDIFLAALEEIKEETEQLIEVQGEPEEEEEEEDTEDDGAEDDWWVLCKTMLNTATYARNQGERGGSFCSSQPWQS